MWFDSLESRLLSMATGKKNFKSFSNETSSSSPSCNVVPYPREKHMSYTNNAISHLSHIHSLPPLCHPTRSMKLNKLPLPGFSLEWDFPGLYQGAWSMHSWGLGHCHLGFEQGMQQMLQLFPHLCANTSNWKLYSALIDTYQLYAGIGRPVLEDTQPLPWCPLGWLSSICQFLYSINSQIKLDHPWLSPSCQAHDCHIMDDVISLSPKATVYYQQCLSISVCFYPV